MPPNLLVGQGAIDYANEKGLLTVFNDYMVSKGAKERWIKWKKDLDLVEEQGKQTRIQHSMGSTTFSSELKLANQAAISSSSEISPPISPSSLRTASAIPQIAATSRPLMASTSDIPDTFFDPQTKHHPTYLGVPRPPISDPIGNTDMDLNRNVDGNRAAAASFDIATDDDHPWASKRRRLSGRSDGSFDESQTVLGKVAALSFPRPHKSHNSASASGFRSGQRDEDRIIDTVGAIAVDCFGNIAAGSSSGGIGMKHRGRCGPAALVGIGTAVIPADPEDPDETSVATVTSGTGEHMATTLAAATCADRIYSSVRKARGGGLESCTEDQALYSVIDREFMGHPGVKNSHCAGAIGVLAVKKTRHGIMLFFGHNTDSFAVASMQSGDRKPSAVMSRSRGGAAIAQGGRVAKYRGNGYRP